MTDPIDRRTALRRLGQAGLVLGGAGVATALGLLSPGRWRREVVAQTLPATWLPDDPRWPGAVITRGAAPDALVRAAVDAVGGIARFVQPGERVLVKPNMAWDRTPAQGANTHPEVIAAVVRLCREARASRVIVAEVPVHDADRVVSRSGIGAAAREAGAELALPPDHGFVLASLGGTVLDQWEVYAPSLDIDRTINVPVVKDHSLSRMTCGLKNWYGLLGGARAQLHQRIHPSIADLGAAFRPSLTVVDATRVMVRGGPTGGGLDDVEPVGAVGAGTDAVALDAWGATLLGADPRDIPHIVLAEGKGLGRLDALPLEEIHVGT
jgi:uncharacterized protein (DUF362 family)